MGGVPDVTVVVATYNRAARLAEALDALARQSFPSDRFEVVVVVDGSTDDTVDRLGRLQTPYALRVTRQENAGHAAALNAGVERARGAWCVFLDDDVTAERGLIAEHVRHQVTEGGILALGRLWTVPGRPDDPYCRDLARRLDGHYEDLASGRRSPTFADCYIGNVSAARAAVIAAGGFREDVGRGFDVEFGYRMVRSGLPVRFLADAGGRHALDKGRRELVREAVQGGAAEVAIHRLHRETLPALALGAPPGSLWRRAVRRALLAARVPPGRLAAAVAAVPRGRGAPLLPIVDDHAYWTGVRQAAGRDWNTFGRGAAILMYHAIGGPGEPASRFVIPARRFARQMRLLRVLRCTVLPLDGVVDRLRAGEPLPPRAVALTFDDGYADNVGIALPVLRRLGLPATFFLVTEPMGDVNRWDAHGVVAGRALATWDAIRAAVIRDGVSVGAHTRTHPALPTLTLEQASEEMAGSRREIEAHLGVRPRLFAYPYGAATPAVHALAERVGFAGACGVSEGLSRPGTRTYDLHRTEIHGEDSLLRFVLAVRLGRTLHGRSLVASAFGRLGARAIARLRPLRYLRPGRPS